jgi:ketosteroid isomerase-like protein
MSRENVEMVRRGYERFNATGEPDYEALDPEIVFDVSRRTFDPGVYRGREGVRQLLAAQREQWRTMRLEPQDFVDAGDQVIVSVRVVAVGRESGVETTADRADVWRFREGRTVRQTTFQTMLDALEAAGLSE